MRLRRSGHTASFMQGSEQGRLTFRQRCGFSLALGSLKEQRGAGFDISSIAKHAQAFWILRLVGWRLIEGDSMFASMHILCIIRSVEGMPPSL